MFARYPTTNFCTGPARSRPAVRIYRTQNYVICLSFTNICPASKGKSPNNGKIDINYNFFS